MQTKMSGSPLHKEGKIGKAIGTTVGLIGGGIGGFLLGGPAGAFKGAQLGAQAGGAVGGAAGSAIDQRQKEKGTGPYAEEAAAQERLLANQQAIADAVSENRKSMEEYNTGVDLAAQALSSPATMKKLTAVGMSYSPMKMKMKEAQMGGKMMEISGASTLPERY